MYMDSRLGTLSLGYMYSMLGTLSLGPQVGASAFCNEKLEVVYEQCKDIYTKQSMTFSLITNLISIISYITFYFLFNQIVVSTIDLPQYLQNKDLYGHG